MFPQLFCRLILLLLGWQSPTTQQIKFLTQPQKSIMIYPHTSYFDFLIMLLYKIGYNFDNFNVVVNEGIYNKYRNIMDKIGCFPATAKEKNNGGFVERTISRFKNSDSYNILISPEGALRKVAWRSGYYHLAVGLNVPIHTVGVDYSTHKIVTIENTKFIESLEVVQSLLRIQFETIIPLYPECSDVPIRHSTLPTVLDYCTFTSMVFPVYGIIQTFWIDKLCCGLLILAYGFSFLYHQSHETKYRKIEPTIVIISMIYLMYSLISQNRFIVDIYSISLLALSFVLYFVAAGRHCCRIRSKKYIIYHSLFHIVTSVATSYHAYYIKN
jgi:1-acyl-sn-glycerol-3-phosphate acyltransferase